MSWEKVKLLGCCQSIADGDHQPPPKTSKGIPFVTISNINAFNQFDFRNTMFVPYDYYNKLDEKRKAQQDDILYTVVGTFGIPVFIKENKPFVFQRHIAILRPNKKIHPKFLYYSMLSDEFCRQADSIALGAAQRTISLSSLRNMSISLPNLPVQQRIADILSAYDDLIEINNRQIKLLEEAAQRLYKEWFVDFRFPGYETTEFIDGLPKGWSNVQLSKLGKVITGKTPSTAIVENYGSAVPFVTIPDMYQGVYPISTQRSLSLQGALSQKNKFLPKDSLIVSCIATVGLVCINHFVCQTNQQINSMIFNDKIYLYYTYFCLKELKSLLEGIGSNGATMTNVNKTKFENIEITIPNTDLMEQFYSFANSIFQKIKILQIENQKLCVSRDALLPKLMSGELEV